MATKKEFQTYMEQNKANLNREALQGADMDMVYNEWKDTGSIGKNYMAQPNPVTTQTNPIQTPEQAKQGLNVLTPEQLKAKNLGQPQTIQQEQPKPVNQQIPNQIDQTQPLQTTTTKSEPLPQTIAPKTMPVTEIKPGEAPTLETPKYQSQIDNFLKTGSIAEARNKLKEGLNAGVIDKATYDKGEAYLWQQVNQKQQEGIKGDEERMRVEEEQRKMQMDPNNLFNSIRTGQSVSQEIKNSPEYKRQQERANRLNQFENMSPSDLSYAMTNGQLFNGTETYNDLKNVNPGLVRQAEQLMSLNSALSTRKSSVEETRESISKAIIGKMTDSEVTDLKGIISQNPEIVSLNDKLAQSKTELDDLKDSIDNMEEDLMMQLSGTGATKGYIQAKASKMNRDLIRQYNAKLNEYNTTAGQLQTITENIKYEIGLQEQRKAKELQALQFAYGIASDELNYERGLEAEQRARVFQLEDRQYQEDLAQRQLEQRYAYEYGDLNSENPTLQNIAIERAVGSMYQNYPIPGMESQAVKVQKVKNLMAKGMTGTQAVAQVEGEIRNSQRYKDYIASQAPQAKTTQPIKMGEDSLYDPNTGKWIMKPTGLGDLRDLASQFPGQAWAKNNNPAGITWNANFDAGTGTAGLLKEAGINFSKGTARPANEGGNYVTFDTIEDGLKAQRIIMTKTYGNSTVEQMLGKWVGTGEALNYAKQVAGNAGVSLNAKVSSLSDDQISQLQMAKIQKESPGLFNILQGAGSETTFSRQNEPQYRNYLTTGKIGTNAEEIKQIEKEFGSVENFKKQAEAYNNSPGGPREQEIKQINKIKDTLQELTKETGAISNVAGTIATALTPGGLLEKKDFLGKIQNVLDQKTLQSLIDAKGEGATFGALSNEELRMLQAVGSVLSARAIRDKETNTIKYFDMSETALKNELQKMIDMYNQNINKINVKMGKTGQVDTNGTFTNSVKGTSGNTYTW